MDKTPDSVMGHSSIPKGIGESANPSAKAYSDAIALWSEALKIINAETVAKNYPGEKYLEESNILKVLQSVL